MSFKHPFLDPAIDPRISKLWQFGHFQSPDHPTDVKQKDVGKLKLKDKAVKEAVQSYQEFFSDDLHHISKEVHGRLATPDGDLGPATSILLDMPRCGSPDFGVTAEARWPDNCVNNLSISYFFDSINAEVAKRAWDHALKQWRDAIEMGFDLRDSFSRNTHVWATDSALSGSILAWSMLAQGSCNQNAEQRYNTRTNWSWEYLSRTMQHELGHAWGMGHHNSRSAIMYPSIQPHMSPQPPDIAVMVRLGYKKRVGPPPPDDDDPPPPFPGGWTGQLVNASSGQKIKLFGLPS